MEIISPDTTAVRTRRRMGMALAGILLLALAAGGWLWYEQSTAANAKGAGAGAGAIQVVSAVVVQSDVSARLTANGTASAQQTVEIRPQISATVKAVHIKEGQFVRKGDRLFTLDARAEDANLSKTEAQLSKARADLVTAERDLVTAERDLAQWQPVIEWLKA